MLVVREYAGHRDDPAVAERLTGTEPLRVVLSNTERRRSRVRTTTVDGRDLGVVVARDLADGDVLVTEDGTPIVVELEGIEALVLDLGGVELLPAKALELGHALGNRHWDLALRGEEALFPVRTSRERTEAIVADVVPETVPYRFETVPPTTFDDGGTHSTGAAHTHGGEHAHAHGSHGHEEADPHAHEEAHSHAHGPHTHVHDVGRITGDEE